jgi:MFS family permease
VRFFYGWVIVAVAAVNGSFLLGSAQFALGAFLVPMEEELKWNRSVLFGALAVRQLLGGLLGPLVGPWMDRPNAPRILMPLGGLLLGLSLMSVRWVHEPLWFFLSYGLVGAFGFALINTTMWDSVVLKWFVRKRAKATVWASFGSASAAMIFPLLVTGLILWLGWRDAWLWYGILTIAILLPTGLLVRGRPEQVGQLLDGDRQPPPDSRTSLAANDERSLTRGVAMRTPAFWFIGGAFMMTGFTINSFQAHWIPYMRDIGFSAGVAAGAVSVYGAFNVMSRVLWGWLSSRFDIHTLLVVHTIAAGLGVGFMLVIDNKPMLFAWAAYQGLFLGSYNYLHTLITAEYFGRMHIGAIRGTMLPASSVLRAGGPLLLGVMRDLRDTYTLAFVSVWVTWGIVTVAIVAARRPTGGRPSRPDLGAPGATAQQQD